MQHVVLGGIQDIGGSETLLGASARTFFGSTVVVMAVNRLPGWRECTFTVVQTECLKLKVG